MTVFLSRSAAASPGDRMRVLGTAAATLVLATFAGCRFPEYAFSTLEAASGAGGGLAGSGSAGANNDVAGSAGALSGAGVSAAGGGGGPSGAGSPNGGAPGASAGSAGQLGCVAGGSGGEAPASCSNGVKDVDESAQDCGGAVCHPCFHAETCVANRDCISAECTAAKTCAPLFELETQPIVSTRSTFTVQFKFRLRYRETKPLGLKTLSLRYYFARGDTAEPLLPNATQAVLNGTTSIAPETHWDVVRVNAISPELTNAYLEVTFSGAKVLLQDDSIELTQSIQAGNSPNHPFDQLTHYSFSSADGYALNERVTVYRDGQLAWGSPPPFSVAEGCFYTAVNFAGKAFSSSGHDFIAGDDPSVQFSGDTLQLTSVPFPTPAAAYLPMLQSAIVLNTEHAAVSVPNGAYWLYPYVISGAGSDLADLLAQGDTQASFAAGTIDGVPTWARLGPYSVTVKNGKLDLASSGGPLRLAGAELFQVAQ